MGRKESNKKKPSNSTLVITKSTEQVHDKQSDTHQSSQNLRCEHGDTFSALSNESGWVDAQASLGLRWANKMFSLDFHTLAIMALI